MHEDRVPACPAGADRPVAVGEVRVDCVLCARAASAPAGVEKTEGFGIGGWSFRAPGDGPHCRDGCMPIITGQPPPQHCLIEDRGPVKVTALGADQVFHSNTRLRWGAMLGHGGQRRVEQLSPMRQDWLAGPPGRPAGQRRQSMPGLGI